MMNGEQIVNDWLLLQGLDWRGDLTGLIDGAIENARKNERLKMLAELSGIEEVAIENESATFADFMANRKIEPAKQNGDEK